MKMNRKLLLAVLTLLLAAALAISPFAAEEAAVSVVLEAPDSASGTVSGMQDPDRLLAAFYDENGKFLSASFPESADGTWSAQSPVPAAFARAFLLNGDSEPVCDYAQAAQNAVCGFGGKTFRTLEEAMDAARSYPEIIRNGEEPRPDDNGEERALYPQIDIFGEVELDGVLTLESGMILNVLNGGSLTAGAAELMPGHYSEDAVDNPYILVSGGGTLILGDVVCAGEGAFLAPEEDALLALVGPNYDPEQPEAVGAPMAVLMGRFTAQADTELSGLSVLMLRAGAELDVQGDLTLGDGMQLMLLSQSDESGTIPSGLNVTGDLTLTGSAIVWERTEITVGGDLRLADRNFYGLFDYFDEETDEYREGPRVAVTGCLAMGENTELMLSPHWGEDGFEGYGAFLTAANIAQTPEEAAAMAGSGGTVYVAQTACGRVDALTVSQSAVLRRLDGGVRLELGALTVEQGQSLVIADGVELCTDEMRLDGTVYAYGGLLADENACIGDGTLWQGRNYADFVRAVWETCGFCFEMEDADWDASALFDGEGDGWQRLCDAEDRNACSGFALLRKLGLLTDGSLYDPWQPMTQSELLSLLEELAEPLGMAELPEEVRNALTPEEALFAMRLRERYNGNGEAEGRFFYGQYEDALDRLYESLCRAEVSGEQELREALASPLKRNIFITSDTEITAELAIPGEFGDRHVYVEPGVTLTVGEEVLLRIENGTELIVLWDEDGQNHGTLRILGLVERMGGLDPDWDEDERLEFGENGGIVRFCDTMEFTKRVWERVQDILPAATQEEKDAFAEISREDWPEWDDRFDAFAAAVKYLGEERLDLLFDGERWHPYETLCYRMAYELLGAYYDAVFPEGESWDTVLAMLTAEADVDPEAQDDWAMPEDQSERLLTSFTLLLPKTETEDCTFLLNRVEGRETVNDREDTTVRGLRFLDTVQVFTGNRADPSGDYDDYAGEIFFENCEFTQGIRIFTEPGIWFNVRFAGCTGDEITLELPEGVGSGEDCPERTGIGVMGDPDGFTVQTNGAPVHFADLHPASFTVDGMTFAAESRDYDIDARWDDWGWDDETQQPTGKIRTFELHNRDMEHPAELGGIFGGKLRICGSVDVSGLCFTGEGCAELAEDFDEEENPRPSEIWLGENRLRINEDYRSECSVTADGGGGIDAWMLREASVRLNEVPVGGAHIFGRDGFGIFLPWSGLPENTSGRIWQDTPEGPQELDYYGEFVDEDGDGTPDKLHLGQKEDSPWITDPVGVRMEIFVGDAVFVFERLWWKDMPVSAEAFSLEEVTQLLSGDTEHIHLMEPAEGLGGTLTVPEGRMVFLHSDVTADAEDTLEICGTVQSEARLVLDGALRIDPTGGEQMFVQLIVADGTVEVNGTLETVTIVPEDGPTQFGEILVQNGTLDLRGMTSCTEGSSVCWEGGEILLPETGIPAGLTVTALLHDDLATEETLSYVLTCGAFNLVMVQTPLTVTQDITVPAGIELVILADIIEAGGRLIFPE